MTKKYSLALMAGLMALGSFAYTVEREVMTIQLKDGSTRTFDVEGISQVSFAVETETVGFELITSSSDTVKSETVGTFFRAIPEESGVPVSFAFCGQNVETVAEMLPCGYAVVVDIPANQLYNGQQLDLTDEANGSVTIYKYTEEGAVDFSYFRVTEGYVTTLRDAKGVVTFELNASVEDKENHSATIYATYKGRPTDVESIAELNPAPVYSNQYVYFNVDGIKSIDHKILSVKRTVSSFSGMITYRFTTDDDAYLQIQVSEEADCKGELDMATAPNNSINFRYDNIQVSSPNDQGRFTATNGKISITDNGDGTYSFSADVTNTYINPIYQSTGGTPERVVMEFTGAVD